MSDHSKVLVPAEAWTFHSPDLFVDGRSVDLGLIAEALIYYDQVLIHPTNSQQLAQIIAWFLNQGRFGDLLALLRDGNLGIVDFAFMTVPVQHEHGYTIMNIQDPIQEQPGTFAQRFLYHDDVAKVLTKSRHREQLFKACNDRVTEFKADQFASGTENARNDAVDPKRAELVVQSLVDEMYLIRKFGAPPTIHATIEALEDGHKHNITWNFEIATLFRGLPKEVGFHMGQPLTALALANRVIWGAAELNCDLFLGNPMSSLVGNKLAESARSIVSTSATIDELQAEVEFPDVRRLVNDGTLGVADLLRIRSRAKKFRQWLQDEADRDRNMLIAYHHEVAKEAGFVKVSRRALSAFGLLGGAAAGGAIGALGGPLTGAIGGAAGSAAGYILEVAAKLGSDWRPVVFGRWLKRHIDAKL